MKQYLVTIDSTHSGFVNGNNTWYIEEDMKVATSSWLYPYNKPVLVHHNMLGDAIGYVIDAQYVEDPNPQAGHPKGWIRLKVVISDEVAAQKVMDKRYNTVSISADSSFAKCSICDHKIHEDGLCEHVRGKTYKGQKCFWYIGGLKYKEVSFVNSPADEYARTLMIEERQMDGGTMAMQNSQTQDPKTVTVADTATQTPPSAPPPVVTSDEEEWKDFTEDDLAMAYWLMTEVDNELTEDAKLSTEKRKALPGSSFCGPGRSFPVNDCAHYTAAKRLIGRYKGPGDKKRIMSCIERKGAKLGCGKSNTKDECMEKLEDVILRDDVKQHIDAEVAKRVKDTEAKLSALTALDEKVKTQTKELETKDKDMKALKDNVTKLETDNTNLKTELHKGLVEKVFDLRKNLKKPDVMSLKDDKETDTYKVELAKRSDESLKDSIQDLTKEDVRPAASPTVTPKPDEVVDSASSATPITSVADPKERQKLVNKVIFSDK